MFLRSSCKHWDGVVELGNLDFVSMTRFGFHDPAIVHVSDGIGVMKDTGVVRNDNHGALGMNSVFREQFHHTFASRVIERRSWLVAKDQTRFVHEGAGQSDALLFTTGKLIWQRTEARRHSEFH
jgi:hypothetical protein